MRTPALLLGAVAIGALTGFAATQAGASPATPFYDTLHTNTTAGGTQILEPTAPLRGGPMGLEFNSGSTTTLGAVQLQLEAGTPGDGGSLSLYLVPNNAVADPNVLGSPPSPQNNGGTGTTFAFSGPATLLGSIADSSLPLSTPTSSGATLTLNLASLLSLTADTEYWLGVTATGSASFVFDHTTYLTGIGTSGQDNFFQAAVTNPACTTNNVVCGTPGVPTVYADANGQNIYEAALFSSNISNIPEPASLALLGAGLAGLGMVRRRRASRLGVQSDVNSSNG
jgi:hypothetical protein